MGYKIDLHTHSTASPDGSLRLHDYQRMLERGQLDVIAITDHDTITMAQEFHDQLGDQIIIGEEITTAEGEIIGLYLQRLVPPLLSAAETVRHIREQGGLVYIPHPFEKVRNGITVEVLDAIAADIDIVECHNGRALFSDRSKAAAVWQHAHASVAAASSDAHGRVGWGKTYSTVIAMPTRNTLVSLLREAEYTVGFPGIKGLVYPKYNRLRKRNWSTD